ncbi:winged helix-turn-helix domain-containing protein [Sphingomonas mesophila]|uniref:winged helix-turn-helix domain-containing protein n=1 Tax=Sphingomonas mesophila TaxID=2303576 RepID=UPI0013C2F203|nr:winged helix-turn-helix domain-containing protein [Sphingomonas mesophila]
MVDPRGDDEIGGHRRWSFAGCVFDEAQWSLTVAGRRVPVEAKPLAMLRYLLLRAGETVSKDELLDTIWPNVTVVEASLTTAVRKLRLALGNEDIVETVSGIGYRLAVPVELEIRRGGNAADGFDAKSVVDPSHRPWGQRSIWIGAAIVLLVIALAVAWGRPRNRAASDVRTPSAPEVADALRELDVAAVKRLVAAGWDPARPWDKEGNDALTILLNQCEWDRAHDRRKMLLIARMLIEGGAPIDRRNVWGDTAYSIAKAPRYCGPDHPVTQMIEAMCYGGSMGPRDLCLATYELTAGQRLAQGLPPKG